MADVDRIDGGPRSVIVVGAGIVGLSTAWFLQERGVEVTVVDRAGVAAGASWGNAGWISPALTLPLNQPSVLRHGLRSLLDPAAPLHIPLKADLGLARFLGRFALNCRTASAERVIERQPAAQRGVLRGVRRARRTTVSTSRGPRRRSPPLFEHRAQADELRREVDELRHAGQDVEVTELTEDELRERVPLASRAVTAGLSIDNQRYVDPGRFVTALGRAVTDRGAQMHQFEVTDVLPVGNRVAVHGLAARRCTPTRP